MREPEADTINQGWINLQEAGVNIDRNELTAMLLKELRAALLHFEKEGLAPFISTVACAWITFLDRPVKLC
jgi:BirA family transcriptional regulator, biotin operon repressor / biotin---[acetyl-CoA-carboxylase] ligase